MSHQLIPHSSIMRVAYIQPSVHHYDVLFSKRAVGGGLGDIRVYNRGGSLLSFMGRFARYALPFIKSIILPEVGNLTKNVMDDVAQGRNIKRVLKERGVESVVNVGRRVARKARGGAVKKKKKTNSKKQSTQKKKTRKKCISKNDIFNTNKFQL